MKNSAYIKIVIILFILLLFSFNYVSAWTGYTHEWICKNAGLENLDCRSADNPSVQKQYPGLGSVHHHCSANTIDCYAREYALYFKNMNTTDTDGFAAHLYADSMTPAHWYSTDYYTCHKIFEDRIAYELEHAGTKIYTIWGDSIDTTKWSFSIECVDKQGNTRQLSVNTSYMYDVANYVAKEMNATPQKSSVQVINLTPIAIVLFVLVISIFILFIIIGRRNIKKRK